MTCVERLHSYISDIPQEDSTPAAVLPALQWKQPAIFPNSWPNKGEIQVIVSTPNSLTQ